MEQMPLIVSNIIALPDHFIVWKSFTIFHTSLVLKWSRLISVQNNYDQDTITCNNREGSRPFNPAVNVTTHTLIVFS